MPTVSIEAGSDRTLTVSVALGAVAVALLLVAPRTSPLGLALLVGLGVVAGAGRLPRVGHIALPVLAFLAFGVWAGVSTLWSFDPRETISKVATLLALLAGVTCFAAALGEARAETLQQAARAAVVAFGAALCFLFVEEVSNHAIKGALAFVLPFLRPSTKHMTEAETSVRLADYISNRSIGAAMLTLWPMVFLARLVVAPARRGLVTAALIGLMLITIYFSQHETSALALAVSGLVVIVAVAAPRVAIGLVAAGWLVATLLVVPAATWGLRSAELQKAAWLPNSARHRIVLWGYTAEQVALRPLQGIGAAATKTLDQTRGPKVDVFPGTKFEWRSGTHAHNVYLQVWYELGAIGAGLLSAAGLALLALMRRLAPAARPLGLATFTAAAVMGASSWGLWQAWFLGAFAMAAALMAWGLRLGTAPGSPAGASSRRPS